MITRKRQQSLSVLLEDNMNLGSQKPIRFHLCPPFAPCVHWCPHNHLLGRTNLFYNASVHFQALLLGMHALSSYLHPGWDVADYGNESFGSSHQLVRRLKHTAVGVLLAPRVLAYDGLD